MLRRFVNDLDHSHLRLVHYFKRNDNQPADLQSRCLVDEVQYGQGSKMGHVHSPQRAPFVQGSRSRLPQPLLLVMYK